jgi:hypothetical protein
LRERWWFHRHARRSTDRGGESERKRSSRLRHGKRKASSGLSTALRSEVSIDTWKLDFDLSSGSKAKEGRRD